MKILASDFDDTIYFKENKEKTKRNIDAIKEFITAGNIFCLITGRTYMEIKKDLISIDLPYTYMICGDGALIFDSNDYCLKSTKLDKELVEKTMKILQENGYQPYMEDGYNITNNPDDCIKISSEYATTKEAGIEITKKISEELNVYTYASRKHVNINSSLNDKKQAVLRLAELEKLNINDFYVIGDNINDYEMLKEFNSAIVENHHPILDELNVPIYKTVADYINYLMEN